jgi:hypothetical protein
MKYTPHKHAAIIKAWADGAEIESRTSDRSDWIACHTPRWHLEVEYRVKPATIADIARNRWHQVQAFGDKALQGDYIWRQTALAAVREADRQRWMAYPQGLGAYLYECLSANGDNSIGFKHLDPESQKRYNEAAQDVVQNFLSGDVK